jgi:hypothetical protein
MIAISTFRLPPANELHAALARLQVDEVTESDARRGMLPVPDIQERLKTLLNDDVWTNVCYQ